MTAEIAIMNKSAVALAADSFVTVSSSSGEDNNRKTYLANKLFTLSKYEPVGVMVYGNADLLGVPWETIVKVYREDLGKRSFAKVEGYVANFITWLGRQHMLFTNKEQRFHTLITVAHYYSFWIKDTITERVKQWTDKNGTISNRKLNSIVRDVIAKHHQLILKKPLLPYLPSGFARRVVREYQAEIKEAYESVLKPFALTAAIKRQLSSIAANYIARDVFPDRGLSGVVIAGFGTKEKYPVVRALQSHRIVLNNLIYRMDDRNSANLNTFPPHATFAAICPFAQRDVVDSFLSGIEPHFLQVIMRYFSQVLGRWPDIVSQSLPSLKDTDKNKLNKKLKKAGVDILKKFGDELRKHVKEKHTNSMFSVVAVLPKEELAAMAESLVSLTSAKRKMSLELETVGGPVDVALVTKGDGFVWINRKHYFKPGLNPHFLATYYEGKT
jgi:hypothetical protein